jgi:hypothetical protein
VTLFSVGRDAAADCSVAIKFIPLLDVSIRLHFLGFQNICIELSDIWRVIFWTAYFVGTLKGVLRLEYAYIYSLWAEDNGITRRFMVLF